MTVSDVNLERDLRPDAGSDADARLHRRLRIAGLVAILAAAVGSVASGTAVGTGAVGDEDCVMRLADSATFSSGCAEQASAEVAH